MPHIKELKNTTEISDLCHKTNELTLNKLEMYQDIAISEYQIDIGETKDAILAISRNEKEVWL